MSSYLSILENIEKAKNRAGRKNDQINVVAVSKNQPIEEINKAYALGCRDFGENRINEALEKISISPKDINWHFIGPLQKNKVNKTINLFTLIHSVDSLELAEKIDQSSKNANTITSVLLQVNTSGETTKQGLSLESWKKNLEKVFLLKNIEIQGLMTMAPLTEDVELIRLTFRRLREFGEELKLPILSMGMSHDYEIAIEEGATLLRIGTAIFTKNAH